MPCQFREISGRKSLFACILICLAGLILTTIAFWPGIVCFDAVRQYNQAVTHSYDSWHPVIMAAWWSVLNRIHAGPAPMLVFQLALYWGALLLCADALRRLRLPCPWAFCLLGFSPFLINCVGVIMKDVGHCVSWAFAFAMVFHAYVRGVRLGIFGAVSAFLCLGYGTLVRPNAPPALLPILGFTVFVQFGRMSWRRLTTATLVGTAAILAMGPVLDYALGAKKLSPIINTMVMDMVGIAVRCGEDVMPDYVRSFPGYSWKEIRANYTPDSVAPLSSDREQRKINLELYGSEGPGAPSPLSACVKAQSVSTLLKSWLCTVIRHPAGYAEHRLSMFRSFLRFGRTGGYVTIWKQSAPSIRMKQWQFKPNVLSTIFFREIEICSGRFAVFFKPYLWLFFGLFYCALLPTYRGSVQVRCGATVLSVSAVCYLIPYLLIAPGADFRFAYWAIWAVAAATAMLSLDMIGRRSLGCNKSLFALGMVLLALLLATDFLLIQLG